MTGVGTPFFLTGHFWAYYFTGYHVAHAYEAAVWGNVIAILPSAPVLAVAGVAAYYFHRRAMAPLHARIDELARAHQDHHDEHVELMKSLLDAMDPETDGGIAELQDRLDPDTPGGIGVLREQLDRLAHSNP